MSKHLGDYAASTVIYGKFTTYQPSTGAAFTLGGTPALSVYKDNSTTQSTAGVTLTADFDSLTGLSHYTVDTSADGAFYSAGSNFDIVITAGTVDSVSVVGTVVGSFSLAKTAALRPTTAGRTLDVSSGGEAGIDWANVGSPTTTLNLSATTIKTATDVETDTADIQTRLPAALVSGRIDASVGAMANNVITSSVIATNAFSNSAFTTGYYNAINAEVDTAFADYDPPTNAEMVARTIVSANYALEATLSSMKGATFDTSTDSLEAIRNRGDAAWTGGLDAAGVRAAVGLASANLDTQLDAIPTATENADAMLNRDMAAVSDTNDRTPLNALRAIRNNVAIAGGTLTVTKEDDSTPAWTAAISTDANALPIIQVNPT